MPHRPSNPIKQPILHYSMLGAILVLGAMLRLWHLDTKPLWLDEVITAIFATGHSQTSVPVGEAFSLSALTDLFTVQRGVSCAQIAQTITIESVHPPLFFCLLYRWMAWLNPTTDQWVWALRSLPALIGVGAIATLYGLNRLAFSPIAGLIGAALMAVSPFAVYLSQEARHYTLPMFLVTLALMALVQIQRDICSQHRPRWLVWLGWAIANSLGLYVHYFFILVVLAQGLALAGWMVSWRVRRSPISMSHWGTLLASAGAIALSYLPWMPIVMAHFSRPETDWLIPYRIDWSDRIAPFYQTLVGWVLMIVALPVEMQSWPVVVLSAAGMLLVAGWLAWQVGQGWRRLWQQPELRPVLQLLGGVTFGVVAQFFAITYLLDKDVTSVPRYNFIYYPGGCALLGACLAAVSRSERRLSTVRFGKLPFNRSAVAIALISGIVSSVFVVYGLVFQKGYYPHQVAQDLTIEPATPLMLGVGYQSLQELGLGLSFALELRRSYPTVPEPPVQIAFLAWQGNRANLWRSLAQLPHSLPLPLNLWVVGSPGMNTRDYPDRLRLRRPNRNGRITCIIDRDRYHRIGFPYQMFRCPAVARSNEEASAEESQSTPAL